MITCGNIKIYDFIVDTSARIACLALARMCVFVTAAIAEKCVIVTPVTVHPVTVVLSNRSDTFGNRCDILC